MTIITSADNTITAMHFHQSDFIIANQSNLHFFFILMLYSCTKLNLIRINHKVIICFISKMLIRLSKKQFKFRFVLSSKLINLNECFYICWIGNFNYLTCFWFCISHISRIYNILLIIIKLWIPTDFISINIYKR